MVSVLDVELEVVPFWVFRQPVLLWILMKQNEQVCKALVVLASDLRGDFVGASDRALLEPLGLAFGSLE